jgi:hypothetical protein
VELKLPSYALERDEILKAPNRSCRGGGDRTQESVPRRGCDARTARRKWEKRAGNRYPFLLAGSYREDLLQNRKVGVSRYEINNHLIKPLILCAVMGGVLSDDLKSPIIAATKELEILALIELLATLMVSSVMDSAVRPPLHKIVGMVECGLNAFSPQRSPIGSNPCCALSSTGIRARKYLCQTTVCIVVFLRYINRAGA